MPLFHKNVEHLGFFLNEMQFSNEKILVIKWSFLMQQVFLNFNKEMPGKWVSKNIIQMVHFNYNKGKSAKEIADLFSLKIKTVKNIISRAEKERLNGLL